MKEVLILLLVLMLILSHMTDGKAIHPESSMEPTEETTTIKIPSSENTPVAETEAEETTHSVDKNDVSNYRGIWKIDGSRCTLTFNKGGIGKYEPNIQGYGIYNFTYEVKDEVIIITYNGQTGSTPSMLELSDDGSSLVMIQFNFIHPTDATEFIRAD